MPHKQKSPSPLVGEGWGEGARGTDFGAPATPHPTLSHKGRGLSAGRESGFTLLEVLVAFVIAALALGIMFDAAIGGLRASETASRYQEGLSLARSHLAAATAGGLAARELSGDDGRGFHFTVRIKPAGTATLARGPNDDPSQATPQQTTLYSVTVTESWHGDGGERQVRLDSARLGAGAAKGG